MRRTENLGGRGYREGNIEHNCPAALEGEAASVISHFSEVRSAEKRKHYVSASPESFPSDDSWSTPYKQKTGSSAFHLLGRTTLG
jgi:hypothetical protein